MHGIGRIRDISGNFSPTDAAKALCLFLENKLHHHDVISFHSLINPTVVSPIFSGPGYGLYFVSYDLVRHRIAVVTGRDEHGFVPSFLAGGVAGCVIWSSTFPFDTIKTRIQCAPFDTSTSQLRIPAMARTIVQNEGITGLYRGLSVSLVRAFPVNACVFPVYGYVLRHLQEGANG